MKRALGFLFLAAAVQAIEPKTNITSDKVRILDRGQSVEFTGNVVLERGEDRLTADRIVTWDSNTVARVTGRVHMRRRLPRANARWEAWGDKAVYDTHTASGTIWGKNRPARAVRRSALETDEETAVNMTARRVTFYKGAPAPGGAEAPAMAQALGAVHIWAEEPIQPPRRTDLWAQQALYDGGADRVTLRGAYDAQRGDAPAPRDPGKPFMRQTHALDRRDLAGETLSFYPAGVRLTVEERVRGDFFFETKAQHPGLSR